MDIVKLSARSREGRGSSQARKKRVSGWIPAVCYSHGKAAESIEISAREFGGVLRAKRASHLMDLGLAGRQDESLAVIKEIQRDVLRPEDVLHIDFQLVAMNEQITVEVPVEVVGVPVGVKDDGGILEHPARHLSVRCLPGDIPDKIVVDVSGLGVNQSLHVRDISVEKAEIVDSPDEVVALVSIPAKEVAVEAVAAEGVAAEGAPAEGAAAKAEGGTAAAAPGGAEKKSS
jgi:large subunit ribosomal protein L25